MEETIQLIRQAHEGDKIARDQLIESNVGLVWSVVRRFTGRGYELEDLFQIGVIGLMKAIDKFDLNFDVRFSTYAVPMIMGEVKRFLRDDGMIKVSRNLKELSFKARVSREELQRIHGREPTLEELAKEIGTTREELAVALESSSEVESLSQVIYQGDGSSITLMEKIEQDGEGTEALINHMTIQKLMKELNETDKKLIILRYFGGWTQMQVAKELGMSQVQVSRMEKKILAQMREKVL